MAINITYPLIVITTLISSWQCFSQDQTQTYQKPISEEKIVGQPTSCILDNLLEKSFYAARRLAQAALISTLYLVFVRSHGIVTAAAGTSVLLVISKLFDIANDVRNTSDLPQKSP